MEETNEAGTEMKSTNKLEKRRTKRLETEGIQITIFCAWVRWWHLPGRAAGAPGRGNALAPAPAAQSQPFVAEVATAGAGAHALA